MKNKIILILLCTIMIFGVCGCENSSDNKIETNEQQQTQEKTEEEKNEAIYLEAKKYYDNKEYGYAYEDFNYIRDYKDVNDILNNDIYFKLGENKYSATTTSYAMSFDFTNPTLFITYVTRVGGDSLHGAYQIIDNQVFLDTSYLSSQYNATDWYITKVTDNSITVKFKNTTYTLNKE